MEDLAAIGADSATIELKFGIVSNDFMSAERAKKDLPEDTTDMSNECFHELWISFSMDRRSIPPIKIPRDSGHIPMLRSIMENEQKEIHQAITNRVDSCLVSL